MARSPAAIEASGSVTTEDTALRNQSTEAKFILTKMDALFSSAPLIRAVLSEAMERVPDASAYVVLDDYYHVALSDQPEVLGYLHQLVKNLPVFLKVCGVRHRLNPFVEGDPPTGVQIGQDADAIGLDLRLDNFQGAQVFLENVLHGICEPVGIKLDQLITDGGRIRLVLGSGGVARDYLNLCRMALRRANERVPEAGRTRNRITAEDVNEASADLSITKQEDLRRDSGPTADQLRKRLTSIASFCLDKNGTNVFLVEGTALSEEEWGKEVSALADLRLVHEIGNTSIQSGEPAYRGKRFVAFTLDLSNWTVHDRRR
jgi:hypothetical protein